MKTPWLDKAIGLLQEEILLSEPTLDKKVLLCILKSGKWFVSLKKEEEPLSEKEKDSLCGEIRTEIQEKLEGLPPNELIRIRKFVVSVADRINKEGEK